MVCSVYVKLPQPDSVVYKVQVTDQKTVTSFYHHLFDNGAIPSSLKDFVYLTKNGFHVEPDEILQNNDSINVNIRLCGGKGGFGSMLRALGSQIEKTTNMEACRDLNGRRMRDVNNEKKMIEWAKKKAEEDKEKERQKIEKLERQLQKPKHFFNDPQYEKSLEVTQDNVEDALKKGMEAYKRKSKLAASSKSNEAPAAKKSKLWLGMGDDDDESESGSSADEDDLFPIMRSRQPKSKDGASTSSAHPVNVEAASSGSDQIPDVVCTETSQSSSDKDKAENSETIGSSDCVKERSVDRPDPECEGSSTEKGSSENVAKDDNVDTGEKCGSESNVEIDLSLYHDAQHLESLGLDALKRALQARGLKCGGTLKQRAERLFSVKDHCPDQIPVKQSTESR